MPAVIDLCAVNVLSLPIKVNAAAPALINFPTNSWTFWPLTLNAPAVTLILNDFNRLTSLPVSVKLPALTVKTRLFVDSDDSGTSESAAIPSMDFYLTQAATQRTKIAFQ